MANGVSGTRNNVTYNEWSKADAVKEYSKYDYDVTSTKWKNETKYTNGQYFMQIQNALYSGEIEQDVNGVKTDMTPYISAMDKSMRPLSDNIMLTRTLTVSNWENSVGVNKNALLAITGGGSTDYTALNGAIGKTIKSKGFLSTSYDENMNGMAGAQVMLKLKTPKGTKAVVTGNHAESEVVLHRNGKYKITGYEVIKKGQYKSQVIFYADFT